MSFENEIEEQLLTPQLWPTYVYCHAEDWKFWCTPKSTYMIRRLLQAVSGKRKSIKKRVLDNFLK